MCSDACEEKRAVRIWVQDDWKWSQHCLSVAWVLSHRVFLWVGGLGSDDGVKAARWQRTEFLPNCSNLQQSSECLKTKKTEIQTIHTSTNKILRKNMILKATNKMKRVWRNWVNYYLIANLTPLHYRLFVNKCLHFCLAFISLGNTNPVKVYQNLLYF